MDTKEIKYTFSDNKFLDNDLKTLDQSMTIIKICCGACHTLCVDKNGNVYTGGMNSCGQLGFGEIYDLHTSDKHISLTKIENLPKIIDIGCGENFSILIDDQYDVYFFGSIGASYDYERFKTPKLLDNIKAVKVFASKNSSNAYLLSPENKIYCFGLNDSGNLGNGTEEMVINPQELKLKSNIVDIKSTLCSTMFLDGDGNVYSCGINDYGLLGFDGLLGYRIYTPVKLCSCFLSLDFEDVPPITKIACGSYHTILLSVENTVYSFGDDSMGQLGHDGYFSDVTYPKKIKNLPPIMDIYCNNHSTFLVDDEGYFWVFGSNSGNNLGLDEIKNVTKPEINKKLLEIIYMRSANPKVDIKSARKNII